MDGGKEEKKQGGSSKAGAYIPRKCSWTHKLLPASDRGSTQINIAVLDPKGVAEKVTFFLFFLVCLFTIDFWKWIDLNRESI